MRPICAKKILVVKAILLAWMLAGAMPVKAFNAIERYQNQIQGKLKKGDTLLLKDEKFLNSAFDWKKIHNKTVSNLITFGLYRDSGVAMPKAFKCEIDLKVEYWSQPDQTDPIVEDHIKMEVNYDPTPGVSYKDAALYRFMNGHRVKITINKITSAELGESLPAIFQLRSELVVERSYEMDPEAKLLPRAIVQQSQGGEGDIRARAAGIAQNPYAVSLSWDHPEGPEEFDLEWTFVDEESANGTLLSGSDMAEDTLKKIFRNNATRVTVSGNTYDITLVHYSKYLIVRMRTVRYDDNNFRIEEPWTYKMEQNGVEVPAVIVLDNVWHQPDLNWDYSAVYAEEGKKKEVVSYFDGTSRNRQTVTVNNSDNRAVVQESVYDEFGRPLASILPAPKKENAFQYYTKLHLAPDNSIYNFKNVYNGTGACVNTPLPLLSDSGAARYYSPNNDFLSDPNMPGNRYIPDAEGYPFAVTRYTPDNTGRVSIQGGLGKLFQPGPDNQVSKATRFYYGKPEQWELNRLFGNDVGYASHYLKQMTVDPNGQISITYQNSAGKTIATALAGTSPANVDRLPSTPDSVEQTILLLNREFSFDPAKLRISATSTYMNTVPGWASVFVNTPQLVMKYAEGNVNICSNCYYELKIVVTDDCNKVVFKTESPIKIGRETGECVTNGYASNTSFEANLVKIGEYYFSFELGMKEDVINAYTKAYVDQNTNLKGEWSFINDVLQDKNFFSCFNDCVTCKESLGQLADFSARIKERLETNGVDINKNATDINDWINRLYSSLSSQCTALRATCKSSPCADLENTMKQDVSPGGQYALFDYKLSPVEPQINVLNLHWREVFPIKDTTSTEYQKELIYLPDGNRISPYDAAFTLQMLVTYWKSEWAASFVQVHPEYCALEFCRNNSESFAFDERLKTLANKVTDIPDIVSGANYSRTDTWLFDKDAFFKSGGKGEPFKDEFLDDLRFYSRRVAGADGPYVKGISQFVDYMVYCADYTGNTNINNTGTLEGDNWTTCQPVEACRVADREWVLYRDKYLELKEKYYQKVRNTSAYCGEKCPVGAPYAYEQSDCPDPSKFVFSVMPYRCAGEIYNNVVVSYLGTPLKEPISVDIYYPPQYDGLPDVFRPRNRTIPAGLTSTNFCLDTTIAVGSMRVSNVNCGVANRASAAAVSFGCNASTISYFHVQPTYSEIEDNTTIVVTYVGPPFPPGAAVELQGNPPYTQFGQIFYSATDRYEAMHPADLRDITFSVKSCDPGDVVEPTCDPAYKYKVSRIGNISYDVPVISTDPNELKAMSDAAIAKMVADNCERQAEEWMIALKPGITAVRINGEKQQELKSKLLEICKTGGDLTHPYGATNLPADRTTSTGVNSFEAAIKSILGTNPDQNMICSYNLIDAPFPYVNNVTQLNAKVQQQAVSVPVNKTSTAICDRLATLTAEFNASNSGGNLFTYLQGKYGASMTITQAELTSLQKGCQNCRFLLDKDIILPVFLDGDAKGCVSGTEFLLAWNKLLDDMDAAEGKMPVDHPNYEKIVTNYFNGIFGFTLAYYDYKKFIDVVTAAGSSGTQILCNRPVYSTVKQDDYACMMEVIDDATSTGHVLYTEYIEEIKKKFRKDYIAYCSPVKPRVAMTSWQQNYHYTLYYYDQVGNLVRTVPPEGVHPLDDALSAQIDAIRDQQPAACNYSGPVFNANVVEVKQKLTAALDLTTNEAMEMWVYNSNGGGGQVMTTTSNNKYLVNTCVNGSRLSFEVYSITPSTDAREADITLTGQSVADISNLLPLQPWTHIVLQGQGLNKNIVNVFVNGIKCPLVPSESPVCGWEIATTSGAIKYPENLTFLKHLRLYSRQLTAEEIAGNAKEGCFWLSPTYMASLTSALTYEARFNMPAAGAPGTIGGGTTETRSVPIYPLHTLTTSYAYQSLNGVEAQKTPDAGTSRFWYDRLGRLVASQNAEQLNSSSSQLSNRFSYTKYDEQGRIIEVGEKTGSTTPVLNPFLSALDANSFLASGTNGQLMRTFYDIAYAGADVSISGVQANLRKRVAATTFEKTAGTIQQATYYSYDQIGNVKTLWQQIDGLETKQIDYQYDLVSGKVNKVRYQYGKPDQFFYGYNYDAENRLTGVETDIYRAATDGWTMQRPHRDAGYRYLLHGPLARTELGADQFVQGIDYAYTLQGWLKGVNGNYLEAAKEIGKDGTDNYGRKSIGRDVYGYSLDYFRGDYKPIGTTDATAFSLAWDDTSQPSDIGYDLFNGNISRSSLALKNIDESKPVGYSYRYDQLNRLREMRQHQLVTGATTWSASTADTPFKESVAYDGNGNILSYLRNGSRTGGDMMDKLSYIYSRDVSGNLINNRLRQVVDDVDNLNYKDDIKSQPANNYIYDNIGNLIRDASSLITGINESPGIKWTLAGKIEAIIKSDNSSLEYRYDAAGNRVFKQHTDGAGKVSRTWYVRDAQGNILAIYGNKDNDDKIYWKEQQLYGSSRLGVWNINSELTSTEIANKWSEKGNKHYELTNHLGNVLATISDKVVAVEGEVDRYEAEVITAQDYYPFGMLQPNRQFSLGNYRYGFNGKENDNEVKGEGNQQDYGFRVYDPRIGKFLSVDPLTPKYPELTPYQFASNRPIDGIDLDGLEHSPASAKLMRDNTAVMRIPHPAEIEAVKRDQEYAAMHRDPPTAKLDFDYTHTIWGSKGGKAATDKMFEYESNALPGGPLAIKALKGEQITTKDVVVEAAISFIPIGKIFRGLKGPGKEILEQVAHKTDDLATHLTEKDIEGAIRDINNNPVIINGKEYQHLKEVKEAILGLENQIYKVRRLIEDGKVTGEMLEAAKSIRSNLQKQKDNIQAVLDRAENAVKNAKK